MKLYSILLIGLTGLSLTTSCDDFLDRAPLTNITEKNFFNTPSDLETYTNGFYNMIGASTNDIGTDNISICTSGSTTDQMVTGTISPTNIGGWSDWGNLRSINYFLDHAGKSSGSAEDNAHYVGIAKFFRAKFYVNKVKHYSNVPWYSTALAVDDSLLFKKQDSRKLVMDSVLNDLQYAADHIKTDIGKRTRVNRWVALTMMGRVCLYEGTYRKYHSELGLEQDYTRFLEKAVWACEEVMKSGEFSIYGSSAQDYGDLFCSKNLDNNPEIIMQEASNKDLGVGNNTHSVMGWQWSLSRSLMESYLTKEGKPFTSLPGYDKKSFIDVFQDRDPRLQETIVYPGFKQSPKTDKEAYRPKISFGGYDQLKFYPKDPDLRQGWGQDFTSVPIFRYAEVLLTYAEAKAELGTLTQSDLEQSVNLLRQRVGMPAMNMAEANAHPDPALEKQYPNVKGNNAGVLLEIRRERRVEMACEGLRWDDIQRWAVGELFAADNQGIYIDHLGAIDLTGDGKADIALLASPDDDKTITDQSLTRYYLRKADGADDGFYLTEGTKGHIAFTAYQKNPRSFKSPQYYYWPIPEKQISLNGNLKQPFGW